MVSSVEIDQAVLFIFICLSLACGLVMAYLIYCYDRLSKKQVVARCGHLTSIRGKILFEGEDIQIDLSQAGNIPDKCLDCLKREILGD